MIFRALHLAQPGLMAGRLAGWLAGRPADEIHVIFEIFKIQYTDQSNRLLALFTKRTALLQLYQCILVSFLAKACCKVSF